MHTAVRFAILASSGDKAVEAFIERQPGLSTDEFLPQLESEHRVKHEVRHRKAMGFVN